MMKTFLSVAVFSVLLLATAVNAKKNLWSDEDYKQVLKGTAEDSDQLDDILDKGAASSWHSSGGNDWQESSEQSTYYSSFSINWASSYADSNTGIDSADLEGAQTGELFITEKYVSTYVYSFMHTWVSTGVIHTGGKVSSWTSRYTTYWTSTWTSSFTHTQMVSHYSSEWTSCDSGVNVWTSTYEQEVWDTGSVDSGAHNWDSQGETSTPDAWVSSWESNWESTLSHASSSHWYSASTSFNTNGQASIHQTSWVSGDGQKN